MTIEPNTEIDELANRISELLSSQKLPTHVTEAEISAFFGDKAGAFHRLFDFINLRLKEEGLWGECVLCPHYKNEPRTGYYTFYREGQESLFASARAPETGPYFIRDEARS